MFILCFDCLKARSISMNNTFKNSLETLLFAENFDIAATLDYFFRDVEI